jgi:hypothetical protein
MGVQSRSGPGLGCRVPVGAFHPRLWFDKGDSRLKAEGCRVPVALALALAFCPTLVILTGSGAVGAINKFPPGNFILSAGVNTASVVTPSARRAITATS